MGTHLRVFSISFPINNNLTGFRGCSKIYVASALEGLINRWPLPAGDRECCGKNIRNMINNPLKYHKWVTDNFKAF